MADNREAKQKAAEERLAAEVKLVLASMMAKGSGMEGKPHSTSRLDLESAVSPEPNEAAAYGTRGARMRYIWAEDNEVALKVKNGYNQEIQFIKGQKIGEHQSSNGKLFIRVYQGMDGEKIVEIEEKRGPFGAISISKITHVLLAGGHVIIERCDLFPEAGRASMTTETFEFNEEEEVIHTLHQLEIEGAEPVLVEQEIVHADGSASTYSVGAGHLHIPARRNEPAARLKGWGAGQ